MIDMDLSKVKVSLFAWQGRKVFKLTEKIKEDDLNRILNNGDVIKIGKKRFVRIIKN